MGRRGRRSQLLAGLLTTSAWVLLCAFLVGCDGDSDTTSPVPTPTPDSGADIVPGSRIDEIRIGDPFADVEQAYGEPDRYEAFTLDVFCGVFYYYDALGLAGLIEDDCDGVAATDEPVNTLYARSPYDGTTAEGIGVGSSFTDVLTVYGAPDDVSDIYHWYTRLGVVFSVNAEQLVTEIGVFAPTGAGWPLHLRRETMINRTP